MAGRADRLHPCAAELAAFARDVARDAGEITLRYFRRDPRVDYKPDGTPVTDADRDTEAFLRTAIRRRFPEDAVEGEEFGRDETGNAQRRWILDPIDGTISFVRGVPLYAVLVGVEIDGVAQAGAAHFPALGDTLWAASGGGAFFNKSPARVSRVRSLDEALVLITDGVAAGERADAALRVLRKARIRRGWGDAYGHALVAVGRADVMLDPVVSVWDCAALAPIIEESGGTFTSWSGERTIRGGSAISTNGTLFELVMSEMSPR